MYCVQCTIYYEQHTVCGVQCSQVFQCCSEQCVLDYTAAQLSPPNTALQYSVEYLDVTHCIALY